MLIPSRHHTCSIASPQFGSPQWKQFVFSLGGITNRKKEKLPELREFIAEPPDLFDKDGVVSYSVRSAVISKLSGSGEGTRLSLEKEYDALINRLSSENDSPLERLMI